MILHMDNSSLPCSFATKYFLRAFIKKNNFFLERETISPHRYLTYSYLKIFHKVLFTRSQTFLQHL
uniref:Uncharacterized protein n=1 Tax=Musa acuminata subsp. malaccensis TaxID=214687 RepID=A0A804JRI7_MUSAM